MASKTKKHVKATTTPAAEVSHTDAWRPQVQSEPEFNPFSSTGVAGDARTQIGDNGQEFPPLRDASEDTAPLQGTKDLTDNNSLLDVAASALEAPPRSGGRRRAGTAAATSGSTRARGTAPRQKARRARKTVRSAKKAKRSGATARAKSSGAARARRAKGGRRSARARRGTKRR